MSSWLSADDVPKELIYGYFLSVVDHFELKYNEKIGGKVLQGDEEEEVALPYEYEEEEEENDENESIFDSSFIVYGSGSPSTHHSENDPLEDIEETESVVFATTERKTKGKRRYKRIVIESDDE